MTYHYITKERTNSYWIKHADNVMIYHYITRGRRNSYLIKYSDNITIYHYITGGRRISFSKCYYDKKNSLLFFLQILKACLFDTSLAKSCFEFYSKAVFFECKFRISRSAIFHVQNWPIGLQRVESRIKWHQRLTSLKLQCVIAAHCTCKTSI